MEVSNKHCIVNAHTGDGWYPYGQKRLQKSLIYHGESADFLAYDGFVDDRFDKSCPYNIKASAMRDAINQDYTHLLWLDCSVWAIQNSMPLWDVINEQGYYFWKSGYNCAQVCTDRQLEYFGVTRDEAEGFADCSTSMFGLRYDNPLGKEFLDRWIKAAKDGMFSGDRAHNISESSDSRFMFGRQDQACASLIIGTMGLKMHDPQIYSAVYGENIRKSVIFVMKGM